MKKHILFTALLLFIGCTALCQNKSSTGKPDFDTSTITILDNIDTSENSVLNNAYMAWRDGYSRKLTLTSNDINIIEQLLKDTVSKYNLSADSAIKYLSADSFIVFPDTIRLSDYKRQYLPYMDKNGKRKVWLNIFFRNDSIFNLVGINWKKDPIIAADGGNRFFQLIINLTDRSVLYFELNADVGGYLHKPKSKPKPN